MQSSEVTNFCVSVAHRKNINLAIKKIIFLWLLMHTKGNENENEKKSRNF